MFSVTLATPGGPWLPSTLWLAAWVMAFVPSARVAAWVLSRASSMAPLFKVSAPVAMSMPFASVSAARTM